MPHKADGESGIGRQVSVADVNGDNLPDIVVGGMKGAHVLIHSVKTVANEAWQAAQPKIFDATTANVVAAGRNQARRGR